MRGIKSRDGLMHWAADGTAFGQAAGMKRVAAELEPLQS